MEREVANCVLLSHVYFPTLMTAPSDLVCIAYYMFFKKKRIFTWTQMKGREIAVIQHQMLSGIITFWLVISNNYINTYQCYRGGEGRVEG